MEKKTLLKLTQVRSAAGHLPKHKATLLGLGLRHLNDVSHIESNPCTLGMIKKISYMLKVEEVNN